MEQYVSQLEELGFSYVGQPGGFVPLAFPTDVLEGLRRQAADAARQLGKKKAFIRHEPFEEARVFEKSFSSEKEASSYWLKCREKIEEFNKILSQRAQKFVQCDPDVVPKAGNWVLRLKVFLGGPKIVLGD